MLSVAAAPDAFQGQQIADFAASLLDPRALAIHLRVERWTYDEFPLPGRLFEETLEQLYREDRFLQGTLQIGQQQAGLARLRSPVMAIVNPVGRIVPPRSLLKGLEARAKPACPRSHVRGRSWSDAAACRPLGRAGCARTTLAGHHPVGSSGGPRLTRRMDAALTPAMPGGNIPV